MTEAGPAAMEPPGHAVPSHIRLTARQWTLALLGLSVFMSFYHLDGGAYFEPTDCWVAQTAREMQEAGEWRMPRFAGEPRLQKSPGPYWAVMVSDWLRAGPIDEATARLPNAFAGVVIALTVFCLTRRIAGLRPAIYAGFAVVSSGLLLYWTHRAASDLGLAAFTTVSLAALWVALEDEPAGRRRNAFLLLGYFAAGLGMLYKLPMPLVVVGLPALMYVVVFRRWAVFRPWKLHLLGLLLFCAPWLPWVASVLASEPRAWDKWRVEFVDRFSGDLPNVAGQGSWQYWFFYLLPLGVFCLPYTASLAGALAAPLRQALPEFNRRGAWFCVIWFVCLFLFFTISTGKEMRYLLPALPPLFVLLGIDLADLFSPEGVRRRPVRVAVGLMAAATPLVAAAAMYIVWRYWYRLVGVNEPAPGTLDAPLAPEHLLWPLGIAAAIFSVAAVASAVFFLRRRGDAAFACVVAGMCASWLWAWPRLMPVMASEAGPRDFAAQLASHIPRSEQDDMYQIATHDARVIWYSDFRFPRLIDPLDLLAEQQGRRALTYEHRRYGEEMFKALARPERSLLVMGYAEYALFVTAVDAAARELREPIPPMYVWLRSRWGHPYKSLLLVSNRPPPGWAPRHVEIPDTLRARWEQEARTRFGADLRDVFSGVARRGRESGSAVTP